MLFRSSTTKKKGKKTGSGKPPKSSGSKKKKTDNKGNDVGSDEDEEIMDRRADYVLNDCDPIIENEQIV